MFDREDFQGVNAAYVLELYEKYQRDPHAVDPATREFFEIGRRRLRLSASARQARPPLGEPGPPEGEGESALAPRSYRGRRPDDDVLCKAVGAFNLAQSIRRYGHLAAQIDPLGSRPLGDPALEPATHGVTEDDLRSLPASLVDRARRRGRGVDGRSRRAAAAALLLDHRLRLRAHLRAGRAPLAARRHRDRPLPRAGSIRSIRRAARSADGGRGVREVPAPVVPRQDALLDRRPRHARADPRRGDRRSGRSRACGRRSSAWRIAGA